MKKVLLPLTTIMFLLSCQKMDLKHEIPQPEAAQQQTALRPPKGAVTTVTTENFDNYTIYDSCRNETVLLSGTSTTTITTAQNDTTGLYYLDYVTDLTHVKGVGEITGTVYHGRDHYRGRVKRIGLVEDDGTDNTREIATVVERVRYISKRGQMIRSLIKAKFVQKHGVVLVHTVTESTSCK